MTTIINYSDLCQHNQDGTPCINCQELDATIAWTHHIHDSTTNWNSDDRARVLTRSVQDAQAQLRAHHNRARTP